MLSVFYLNVDWNFICRDMIKNIEDQAKRSLKAEKSGGIRIE